MLSSSTPAELFLSEAHHFEPFALKSPKAIGQVIISNSNSDQSSQEWTIFVIVKIYRN